MPKTTIRDLEDLGYSVGFAHGSVEAEERALEEARTAGSDDVIAAQAAMVTRETVQQLDHAGKLPASVDARAELFAQIGESAYDELQSRASTRMAFHERAVRVAKEMPDVFVISGPGVTNIYVACKPNGTGWDEDQQVILDALADPDAHKERRKQEKAESP